MLCHVGVQAQKTYHQDYDWKETPDKLTANPADTSTDQTLLFEKYSTQYMLEEGSNYQYNLLHTRMLIKTDRAIEENNKMYVGNRPGDEVLVQKVRVIRPDGSITNLKKEDIKESLDEDGEVEYRYFALEGLVKGCVIESLNYTKTPANFTGSVIVVQGSEDVLEGEYEILSPTHLDFRTQTVNGLEEFKLDSTETTIRRKYLNVTDMKALKSEYSCPYNALLKKCYYKLDRNFDSQKHDFYTYNNVAKILHETMFAEPSKTALKKVKAIAKDMESNGGSTIEEKVRYLETQLKSTYPTVDANVDELTDLDYIFKNKVASPVGLTKVFMNVLREAQIPFELVVTSDREENPFIEGYEAYNFLIDYLVYLPGINKYWAPDIISRLGFPPVENTMNKGLFIQEKMLNEMRVPIAKVKEVGISKPEDSQDIIRATVDFTADPVKPDVTIEREVSGYKALYPHSILDYLDEEKLKEAKKEVVQYVSETAKLEDVTAVNDKSVYSGNKPLSVKAKFIDAPFVERAGQTILLKAGMLIGPQAELYNKDKRTLPLTTDFTRQYHRFITVTLPAGYQVKNLESLKMDVTAADKSLGFTSTYQLTGNQLTINVEEFYTKIYYSVEQYADYERVMNAAADFNKIVLVLEKN